MGFNIGSYDQTSMQEKKKKKKDFVLVKASNKFEVKTIPKSKWLIWV